MLKRLLYQNNNISRNIPILISSLFSCSGVFEKPNNNSFNSPIYTRSFSSHDEVFINYNNIFRNNRLVCTRSFSSHDDGSDIIVNTSKKVKDEEKFVESSSSSSSSDGSSDSNDDEKHVAKRAEEKVVESSSHDTRKVMVSTSDFKDIRNSGSVYVDKTKFLSQLCNPKGNRYYFIARPRRFG
jgi:hypothetical protein